MNHWRKTTRNPAQDLARLTGLDKDMDETPVAMFALANGQEVGMSMQEIGDLVASHNEMLACTVLPAPERKRLESECTLAREGAEAIAHKFNELLDDRLRPQPSRSEKPLQANTEFSALMQRLKTGMSHK